MRGKQNPLLRWADDDVSLSAFRAFNEAFGIPRTPLEAAHAEMPDPACFKSPESFRDAYWLAECWSKFPFDLPGVDRTAAAMQSFEEAEQRCASANERLADLWNRPIPERYRTILSEARRTLAHLFEGFTLDEISDRVGWGPGATTSLPRARSTHQNKWVSCSHLTASCLPYYYAFQRWSGWIFDRPIVVAGNKVTTVPKNAKTDRTIAIEPDWNMFFQLGLGRTIRSRLQRRFGILRKNSQQVNRLLARKGSEDGFLATVDLKGASDSVSLALVEALLPSDVLSVVLDLRSPFGELQDGSTVSYEKVSSMGNGFTFELETALFFAIAKAAAGHACVYGDDIVVPSSSVPLLVDVLAFCGFETNTKKTFSHGPFRESCGGHYFGGVDVTPFYVRDRLRGLNRIAHANRITEVTDNGHWRDGFLRGYHDHITKKIPKALFGPKGVDGVVWCDRKEVQQRNWHDHLQCYTGVRLVLEYQPCAAPVIGAYIAALHGVPEFTQWMKPPGVPRLRVRRWWSGWTINPSPWAAVA